MFQFILVFAGGGMGSVLRYATSLMAMRVMGSGFPWGTLLVNLAGCFLIGLAAGISERSPAIGPSGKLLLVTGFLGGFTTFSAFGLETMQAARSGEWAALLLNVVANNGLGLLLVFAGLTIAKLR